MKSREITLEQVRKAKKHVVYEWKQFEYCKKLLDEMRDPINPQYRKANVTKEEHALALSAFVLHARSLIAFFRDDGKNREGNKDNHDVLALDFFVAPDKWVCPVPVLGESWLIEQKSKMHRLAVHITYYRDDPNYAEGWEIDGLFGYLSDVWKEFTNKASPDRWGDDVDNPGKVSADLGSSVFTTSLSS